MQNSIDNDCAIVYTIENKVGACLCHAVFVCQTLMLKALSDLGKLANLLYYVVD